MLLLSFLVHLITCVSAISIGQHPESIATVKRQTQHQAAEHTKFLLHNVTQGSLATVFGSRTDRPGHPFASFEYHSTCLPLPSLTFLLMPISQSTRNILSDPEGRVTYLLNEPRGGERDGIGHGHRGEGRSGMDFARVSLTGTMNRTNLTTNPLDTLESCFTNTHPDSRAWIPSNESSPHYSFFATLEVDEVYYVGGFGDEHYIGHIPVEMIKGKK